MEAGSFPTPRDQGPLRLTGALCALWHQGAHFHRHPFVRVRARMEGLVPRGQLSTSPGCTVETSSPEGNPERPFCPALPRLGPLECLSHWNHKEPSFALSITLESGTLKD